MTKKPKEWTAEQLIEIQAKAEGLYSTLVGLTETPREAAEIITMMHLLLYMNHGNGETNIDDMLKQYVEQFKLNFESQAAAHRAVAN